MTADLRREIKQARPFQTLEQEALLGLERTATVHSHAFAEALKPYGVMPTNSPDCARLAKPSFTSSGCCSVKIGLTGATSSSPIFPALTRT